MTLPLICGDNKHYLMYVNLSNYDTATSVNTFNASVSITVYYAMVTNRKSMWALTVLSLHLLNLVHIGVVLLPVRGRRVVHVCRARHGGLSPATLWNFLNKQFHFRDKSSMPTKPHLTSFDNTSPTFNARGLLPLDLLKIRWTNFNELFSSTRTPCAPEFLFFLDDRVLIFKECLLAARPMSADFNTRAQQ